MRRRRRSSDDYVWKAHRGYDKSRRVPDNLHTVEFNRRGRREGAKSAEPSRCALCAFFESLAIS